MIVRTQCIKESRDVIEFILKKYKSEPGIILYKRIMDEGLYQNEHETYFYMSKKDYQVCDYQKFITHFQDEQLLNFDEWKLIQDMD